MTPKNKTISNDASKTVTPKSKSINKSLSKTRTPQTNTTVNKSGTRGGGCPTEGCKEIVKYCLQ